MKRLSLALVAALVACTARDKPQPPLATTHDAAVSAAPLTPTPPPMVYEVSRAPEAPARLRAMLLSFRHSVRSTVVVPGAVWVATYEDLIWLRTDAQGIAGSGLRIPFHGKLIATPDAKHLFRYEDREIVALDAHGKDTALRAAFAATIWAIVFSRAGRLVGVLTSDRRITIVRSTDLHVVATAMYDHDRAENLSTSADEAFVSVAGTVFDARTGRVVSALPPDTTIVDDDDERHVAPGSKDPRFTGRYALLRATDCRPGNEFTKCGPARATLDDGDLVVSDGVGSEARVRLAPRGTPAVPSEVERQTWQLPDLDVVGEVAGRIVVARFGADVAVLEKGTLTETEHFLFAEHGMLHVRPGGTWETIGEAAQLELAVLCVDGNRVEPAAACKHQNN